MFAPTDRFLSAPSPGSRFSVRVTRTTPDAQRCGLRAVPVRLPPSRGDRKSTRLNSSHDQNSYAVFCLKKKKGVRFITEISKMQAFVDLWDEIVETRYGVKDPTLRRFRYGVFFFNDTATTEIYTLSLHDALPI